MIRPLRIAFVGQKGFPATWGGVEVHVDEIAKRLAARGHEVTAYSRRWYAPAGAGSHDGVTVSYTPTIHTKHMDAPLHSLTSSLHAAATGFDLVHYHAIGPALMCGIPRITGSKVVTTVHALDYRRAKWGRLARVALRAGELAAFRFSHRVTVVSRDLQDHYRRIGHDTVYIPNGVGEPVRVPWSVMEQRHADIEPGYLLYLGRMTPEKRLRELVEVFCATSSNGAQLVVAGDADGDPDYGRAVRRAANGNPRVVFPGYVHGDDKAALLSHARGFVTASSREGLPIAMLEAMAYGLPCVATDIPPHRELLHDAGGSRGLLCAVSDVGPTLERLLAMPDAERAAMGQSARAAAKAYAWDPAVDSLEAVYTDVMARQ